MKRHRMLIKTSYRRGLTEFRTSAEALRLRYCWYTFE